MMRGFKTAFAKMMSTSNTDSLEYSGTLSKFQQIDGNGGGIDPIYKNPNATYLIVCWDKKNNLPTRSWTYKCRATKTDSTKYVLCRPKSSPMIIAYKDFANVHTHPDYLRVDQSNIIDGLYMKYPHLKVSDSDIESVTAYGYLYILNGGNVYELKDKDKEIGIAKIINTF